MKIGIIGAGLGGLRAAKVLADAGVEVHVYEKGAREKLSYDWTDETDNDLFRKFSLPLPEGSFHGDAVAMVAPFSKKPLRVPAPPVEERSWNVERRELTKVLLESAEQAGAHLHFKSPVEKLLFGERGVTGFTVKEGDLLFDLVIDSSGALSPFRKSLPPCFHVTPEPKEDEIFQVFRAIYSPVPGVKNPPDPPRKVYLKHLGESGISWCMAEPNGDVNILVGRTHALSLEGLESAIEALKEDNPVLGDELVRGGNYCTIPIRYTLPRPVAPGYAAVGDAAFMTIPMIGSGISHAIHAGQYLAEAILGEQSVSVPALWKYVVRYYKDFGAGDVCVDVIKRALLSFPAEDIRFLFESGVITQTDMECISSGTQMEMTPAMVFGKIKKGFRKLPTLIRLAKALGEGPKAEALARTIPEAFDEEAVLAWQTKLDAVFGN